ncbi:MULTISPECIES: hypothetical protein [unclassified Streptomyces]|uniref:hypothetical protein n=1 Tax=unclassified Streptomyces TaxID=2593676 RepID=UPI00190984F8|nr:MULTISPECIES: hypothetical protein [unclassified Streptomyces]MBK3566257.1 hypothetical protein [Streptomyces sp. MBT62]MBK6011037.1 hypothetical protein [Streptomyces sp. MBT53]
MTPALPYDAPVTGSALLSFDGRVLEVFGYVDAARYHVWEEPRIEFRSGRIRRLTIITKSGRKHTVLYDEPHLPGLRVLADLLERSRPRTPES